KFIAQYHKLRPVTLKNIDSIGALFNHCLGRLYPSETSLNLRVVASYTCHSPYELIAYELNPDEKYKSFTDTCVMLGILFPWSSKIGCFVFASPYTPGNITVFSRSSVSFVTPRPSIETIELEKISPP